MSVALSVASPRPLPPLRSTTKNIQTQSNGFGTFIQKFQTVTH